MTKTIARLFSPFRANERGVTLIETLLALAIGATLLIAFARAAEQRANSILEAAASSQLKEVARGAKAYVMDNYTSLRDNAPQRLTMATLANYLPPNLKRDAFGQTYAVITRPVMTGGVRTGLEALVVAGDATRPLSLENIAGVASLSGPTAGFYAQSTPPLQCSGQQICGAYGFFATDTAGFAASGFTTPTLVSYVEANNGNAFSEYLYRVAVPGQPQLNRMSTDIDMDGHNINNIGKAGFSGGSGLTETGGALRVWSASNEVRIQGSDGTAQSLAVTDKLNVTNDITACSSGTDGCGQRVSDVGGIVKRTNGYLNLEVDSGGTNGVYVSGGDKGGIINVSDIYLRDRNAWLTDLLPNYIAKNGYIVGDASNLAKPSCPTGQAPKIVMSPHFASLFIRSASAQSSNYNTANDAVLQMYAVDYGSYWQTNIKTYGASGIQAAGPNARAVAITYCYQP